jgi:Right handed beta helix region
MQRRIHASPRLHRGPIVSLLLLVAAIGTVRAATIRVPADAPTIQAGVLAAKAGDEVLVDPGAYREILAMKDSVAVKATGPGTLLLGEVHLHNLRGARLEGFTINSEYGGVHCLASEGNTIIGNLISGGQISEGPGISCFQCRDTITENVLIRRFGIGIYCFQGSPLIRRNTIVECGLGRLARGGIECDFGSTPRIEQNIIAWNVGAALRVSPDSHPVVACNDLFENAGGDQVLGVDGGGNIHRDPLFCNPLAGELGLRPDSPCAAAPGCGVIGALDIACPASAVEPATWGAIKARLAPAGGR